ncbi:MAG TPA: class I SAM-dependent methyltransferase [Candidatus Angelobacter sp.]|nr:class I SAM-dependent methyltransferase [Candidatus Angelobacter sp.]
MSIKQSIKRHPKLKKAAQILRGDQIVALNYPVILKPRYDGGPHPELFKLIYAGHHKFKTRLESFLQYRPQLMALKNVRWINGFLPALDSISLYCLLAQWKPKRYMEIGSGNSTIFARQAIKNNGLATTLISIDPHPRAEIDALCDRVIRTPVEEVELSIFDELETGDILFVDNSHRCLPNSDVTVFFVDILPRLKHGVFIHLHDICLPWDYPESVAQDAYSEQYLLATALLMGNRLDTILPNQLISRTPQLLSILDPIFDSLGKVEREGCSYWMSLASGITSIAQ